ncbi:MAG: glycosyltransferase family 4 protein [Anaerolineae bacterium]
MKIALYHNLPSGGGKRALYEMTKRLAQRHEVDAYTLTTAEHSFGDLQPLVRKHVIFPFQPLPLSKPPFGRLNQGIRTVDLLRLDAVQRRIAAQIDRDGYDVVFVHNCQFSQSPSLLKFLRTPSVYYCAEPPRQLYEPPADRPYNRFSRAQRLGNLVDPFPGLYRRTLRRLDRANTLAATMVLVNSHYSRETLYRTYGIFAHVGRLGVDTELFRPLPLAREQRVVSVGALTPMKGFDFVIRSLGQIEAAQRPALTIVSNYVDPAEYCYLRELAGSLAVQVEFLAGVSDDELVETYNRSLLTVYAPIMEPFGFVPLESMACGTPVVGVNEAGVRETIVHEATGLLVARDPGRFAAAIAALLDDPAQRASLGRQGRAYVQAQWSWDRSVRNIEDHLARAAHGCP